MTYISLKYVPIIIMDLLYFFYAFYLSWALATIVATKWQCFKTKQMLIFALRLTLFVILHVAEAIKHCRLVVVVTHTKIVTCPALPVL